MSRHTEWQKNLDAFYSLSSGKPEVLRAVYERETHGSRDELVLLFTSRALVFQANAEDDTISVRAKNVASYKTNESFRESNAAVWQPLIGRAFGWGWITINQQGYCDGALLSFDGISPGVSLGVVASSIDISRVAHLDEVKSYEIEVIENGKLSSRQFPVRRDTRPAFEKPLGELEGQPLGCSGGTAPALPE
jgi:hypothetical protein